MVVMSAVLSLLPTMKTNGNTFQIVHLVGVDTKVVKEFLDNLPVRLELRDEGEESLDVYVEGSSVSIYPPSGRTVWAGFPRKMPSGVFVETNLSAHCQRNVHFIGIPGWPGKRVDLQLHSYPKVIVEYED